MLIKIRSHVGGHPRRRATGASRHSHQFDAAIYQVSGRGYGQAKVQLISPFVGRIYDWHQKAAGSAWDETARAGRGRNVASVREIYTYYPSTASPLNHGRELSMWGRIIALAGCDLLTISPDLLAQLAPAARAVPRLDAAAAKAQPINALQYDESVFAQRLLRASEKLGRWSARLWCRYGAPRATHAGCLKISRR